MNNMFSPSSLRKILTLGFIAFVIAPLNAVQNITEQLVVHKNATLNNNLSVAHDLVVGNKAQASTVTATTVDAGTVDISGQLILDTPQVAGCCKSISGIISNFDPQRDLLAIDFCTAPGCGTPSTDTFQGAIVNLSFCYTCTPNSNAALLGDEEHCPNCAGAPVTMSVNELYVAPSLSPITHSFYYLRDHQAHYINASALNSNVANCCKLRLYVNQNQFLPTRMVVGLVQYEDTDHADINNIELPNSFWARESCESFSPGCLFYEVKSCNLFDVTTTTTDATSFQTLPADIQALIAAVTSNPTLQETLSLDVLGIGQQFLGILETVGTTSATAILQNLLNDITKGRTTLSAKIKAAQAKRGQDGLFSALRSMNPQINLSNAENDKAEPAKKSKNKRCTSCNK
jgi:hypothetical protein